MPRLRTRFSALLLDVGGVFVIPDRELIDDALSSVGVAPDNFDTDRAHYLGMAAVDRNEGNGDLYLQGYLAALGVNPHDRPRALDAIVGLSRQQSIVLWRQVIADSVDALRTMSDLGVRLGLVSNSDGNVEEQLRQYGICQVGPGSGTEVLVIVDSGAVGVAKPDPAVFASAIAAIDLPAGDIAFVGDSVRYDVLGAEAAGLEPIHLDPYGICQSEHRHHHIRALTDLVAE
jgi:putative hydrolase of the HAD superfamily